MHRPDLNALPADERTLLAGLIQQYTTPNIIRIHRDAIISGAHNNPVTFLSFHRNYIGGLEAFLLELAQSRWVPLPAWNPVEPIPREFNIPDAGLDRLRNLNPNVSFSPEFDQENLPNFRTVEELGQALMARHNLVHSRIGGVMNNLQRAPEAPIFWPFHSYIDDIWWEWQRLTVAVPSCIGMSFSEAEKMLGFCGLGIKKMGHIPYDSGWNRIKGQQPAPLTMAARETPVRLYY